MDTYNNASIHYGNTGSSGNYEWHHIVEQGASKNGYNVMDINSKNNIISLEKDTHTQIGSIYSTKIQNLGNKGIPGLAEMFQGANPSLTVREYLYTSNMSFDKVWDIGVRILQLLGVY